MKTFYSFLAIILLLVTSCDNETVSESFEFNLENEFKIDYDYHSNNNSLNFSITEINDSRCPSDVVCVWEGKADVRIQVISPVRGMILLNSYNHLIDSVGDYSFELKAISPYPVSTKTIKLDEYKVLLKITELAN